MLRIFVLAIAVLFFTEPSLFAFRPQPTSKDIDGLTRQIAAHPDDSSFLRERGFTYAVLGQKDKALADYHAAQKLSPNDRYILWSLGWALFDLGDPASAVKVWESVALAEREHRRIGTNWIFYTLALGYWGEGDKTRAFEFFTKAAKLDAKLQQRDTFEDFTDHWTQKEQAIGLQLFDAWEKEINKPGNHLW